MKKIVLILLAITITLTLPAQKKEIAEAKTNLKANKNLDKAEALLRKVIAMPEQNVKVDNHLLLYNILKKQYENTNEKLYLRQLKDTASVFPLLQRLILASEVLDSVEMMPDKKGRVNIRYRERNAAYLNKVRPNLFNGGLFCTYKKKYKEALSYFETYIDCARQPLFSSLAYAERDTLYSQAAFYALMSASQLKDFAAVKRHAAEAVRYKPKAPVALALLYDEHLEHGDTATAVKFLYEGFEHYSDYPFFFPRLVDYYTARHEMDSVHSVVSIALEREPTNLFYHLAKNTVQLTCGSYDECVALGDSLIRCDSLMAEAYFNVGSAYFNKALQREKVGRENRQKRQEVNELYAQSMPYLEQYRKQRPNAQEKWAPMLYTIYLNLNKGEEFDEIDELIKADKKSKTLKK